MTSMSRRICVAALMAVGLASAARAQGNPPTNAGATLFQNVRIFDGKSGSLSASSSVLVKSNIIERISTMPIAIDGQRIGNRAVPATPQPTASRVSVRQRYS